MWKWENWKPAGEPPDRLHECRLLGSLVWGNRAEDSHFDTVQPPASDTTGTDVKNLDTETKRIGGENRSSVKQLAPVGTQGKWAPLAVKQPPEGPCDRACPTWIDEMTEPDPERDTHEDG
jgi:hypothetical protein